MKVCEIQNGLCSAFNGDAMSYGEYGLVCPRFIDILSEYSVEKWIMSHAMNSWQFKTFPQEHGWKTITQLPNFSQEARLSPVDPSSIASYQGILFVSPQVIDISSVKQNYPGILILDYASYPFWIDKYKMTLLFDQDPILKTFKPEWKLYPKRYSNTLADQIQQEIPSDVYVIKPRGSFCGNGVIIVKAEDLDETLDYILHPSKTLANDPDKSYHHWSRDWFDSFIVEKFYASDPIEVNQKHYQPTMRAAFLMIHNQGVSEVHILTLYWLLPYHPIGEGTTMNDQHKSYIQEDYFTPLDPIAWENVENELQIALPILYEKMLAHPRTSLR